MNISRWLLLAVLLACLPFISSCEPIDSQINATSSDISSPDEAQTLSNDDITVPPVLDEVRQRNVKWLFGDTERFERMFRTGEISFDLMPPYGGNVLHYAAYTGSIPRVKHLLKLHPDVYVRMNHLWWTHRGNPSMSFLRCAVASGNLELVKWLLTDEEVAAELAKTDQRLSISELDFSNRPLVVYSGSVEVAQWLMMNGSYRYVRAGNPPSLNYASVFGEAKLFKWIYASNRSLDFQRNLWNDILINGNVELAQWLLDNNCVPYNENGMSYSENGKNIELSEFFKTQNRLLIYAARSGNLEMVKWLEKQGAQFAPSGSNSDSVLYAAAASGNLDLVKWLVEKGHNVKAQRDNGDPILFGAALSGNLEMVKWLAEQGVDVNAKNKFGDPVIFSAAQSGNLELVKWLIDQGQDINAQRGKSNFTVLDVFAQNGDLKAIKWAITQGGDLNKSPGILGSAVSSGNLELVKWLFAQKVGTVSDTLLHVAARRGSFETLKWLSEQGLDVHALDGNEDTVLHEAARSGHLPMVKWLVEQGLDINASNSELYSVINVTQQNSEVYYWLQEQFKKQAQEKEKNSNVSKNENAVQKSNAFTPQVHDDFRQRNVKRLFGDPEQFEQMFQSGKFYFDLMPPYGASVLHYAAYTGNIARVKALLKINPDVSMRTRWYLSNPYNIHFNHYDCHRVDQEWHSDGTRFGPGMSFLQCAVASGNLELVKWLLTDKELAAELAKTDQRLDINECDSKNNSLLYYSGSVEVAQWLMEKGCKCYNVCDMLAFAAENGNLDLVKWCVSHFKVKTIELDVLCAGAGSGNLELVKWLENNVNVNYLKYRDDKYNAVLFYAARSGNLDLLKWMVSKNRNINVKDNIYTLMHAAAESGNLEMVKWLVEQGYNIKASYNKRLLNAAAKSGSLEVVKWFVEQGQKLDDPANSASRPGGFFSYSIMQYAIQSGNLELVEWLVEQGLTIKKYGIEISDAARYGDLPMLRWLASHKVDFKGVYREAAQSGNLKMVRWLYTKDVTSFPLLYAAKSGNLTMVQWLIRHGENVNASENDNTVLQYAVESDNLRLVKFLVSKGAKGDNVEIISRVVANNNTEMLQWLLSHGVTISDPQLPQIKGALKEAVKKGNIEMAKTLCKHGVNISSVDIATVASVSGNMEMVKWLVDQGMACRNKNGYYILYGAVQSDNLELVKWVVEQGVDVNATYDGMSFMNTQITILNYANPDSKVTQWLQEHGAHY